MKYDYLIVGAGLYGAVCAREAYKKVNAFWLLTNVTMWVGTFIPKNRRN